MIFILKRLYQFYNMHFIYIKKPAFYDQFNFCNILSYFYPEIL